MHPGALVLGGIVLGVAGTKAACSKTARKAAVKGLVAGMKAKESMTTMLDDAKVQFDDLMAEASFEKALDATEAGCSTE